MPVKRIIFNIGSLMLAPFFIVVAVLTALACRYTKQNETQVRKPRFVWGCTPILNYSIWSHILKEQGFQSETFTSGFYAAINRRSDWDRILSEEYPLVPYPFKTLMAFVESLYRYDIFCLSFDGYFLGNTVLWWLEAPLLRLGGKKIIILAYGADAYIYRRVRSVPLAHGLMLSYPENAKSQRKIAAKVDYWCRHADIVAGGFMSFDGQGRWDLLVPSALFIDTGLWKKSDKMPVRGDTQNPVVIAHAPNHRGFKGTEFIVNAVDALKAEGYKIEFLLLEKLQNKEIQSCFEKKVDILVEQLVFTGHGLNGLEGMASGLPVISNMENTEYLEVLRNWSYFGECPIVSASPGTIKDVLKHLIESPDLRKQLGDAGRAYAEKYHSFEAGAYMFGKVIDKIWYGKDVDLINLYHPLLGEYPKSKPKIEHPLVDNKIVGT